MHESLTLPEVEKAANRLAPYTVKTPVHQWPGNEVDSALGSDTEVHVKMEMLQHTGTFKARGAMNNLLALSAEQRKAGVVAVSAGNHAIATAYAAQQLGCSAKIFMPASARAHRIALAQGFGGETIIKDTQIEAFEASEACAKEEGRALIQPFEGPLTLQGTAVAGLEFTQQVPELDAMILPIGGGGLCGGFSAALKQVWPNIKVFGVEPEGANAMSLSRAAGEPVTLDDVNTIADSLAPPMTKPFVFSVCQQTVDEIVLVSDQQLRDAMGLLFDGMKLAVEPAGAATTAALFGPLRDQLAGQKVGIIICGANISKADFCALIS